MAPPELELLPSKVALTMVRLELAELWIPPPLFAELFWKTALVICGVDWILQMAPPFESE